MTHQIARVRHELRRRSLRVLRVEYVTPAMRRVTLGGEDLEGFTSLGADDHVKLFLPGDDGAIAGRDYTPRSFDPAARELAIDFALHEAGPATRWALQAEIGSCLEIGGPRGSLVIGDTFDWWLLIGDETALPAMGRRVEELGVRTRVLTLGIVADRQEEQSWRTEAQHEAHWVYRPLERADDPAPVLAALERIEWPEGDGFVWIAAETHVARAVRAFVVERRAHPTDWLRSSGYWKRGVADAHETIEG